MVRHHAGQDLMLPVQEPLDNRGQDRRVVLELVPKLFEGLPLRGDRSSIHPNLSVVDQLVDARLHKALGAEHHLDRIRYT